ncbi:MAG: hypothetical protein R3Y15_00215 [Rikenellaceae bacterium]
MKIIKFIFSFILLGALGFGLTAQNPSGQEKAVVRASLSSDSIMIGDQFRLKVEITKDLVEQAYFPVFEGTLDSAYIEVLSETPIDTVAREGRVHTLRKEYLLTCFDAGMYELGQFPVMVAGRNQMDTLFSIDSLSLLVTTYEIDTTTQVIVDIVPPLDAPLMFGEFSQYLMYGLLACIIIALIVLYIMRQIAKRRNRADNEVVPPEAAHLKAIKALEKLNSKKLWQAGHIKQYYTALTDIVRTYIEERYDIGALEKSTPEILSEIKATNADDKSFKRLTSLLTTADYVKFAKHTPDAEDNEDNYNNAYYFIEDTKIIEVEQQSNPEQDADPTQSDNQQPKNV